MQSKYVPPTRDLSSFHCPRCHVFAAQVWNEFTYFFHQLIGAPQQRVKTDVAASHCTHCDEGSFWVAERLVDPPTAPVEPAHPDLPADCQSEYAEAVAVFTGSPRAAAALLRLCIQKLLPHLGGKGKKIDDDVADLVRKGLPVTAQQALDFTRVIGNNAVHPGTLDLNDTPEIAQALFKMINYIVQDRITQPREIEALYSSLPQGARDRIKKRDGT